MVDIREGKAEVQAVHGADDGTIYGESALFELLNSQDLATHFALFFFDLAASDSRKNGVAAGY